MQRARRFLFCNLQLLFFAFLTILFFAFFVICFLIFYCISPFEFLPNAKNSDGEQPLRSVRAVIQDES